MKLCYEVCDKTECNERCEKKLVCGHRCIGLCGEHCPPLCATCDAEELLQIDFTGKNVVDISDRYIFLEACGHTIEMSSWEKWLRQDVKDIIPINCPVCNTRATWLRRYSREFQDNFDLINVEKRKIFGTYDHIWEVLTETNTTVENYLTGNTEPPPFTFFVHIIYNEILPQLRTPDGSNNFRSVSFLLLIYIFAIKTISWINCHVSNL